MNKKNITQVTIEDKDIIMSLIRNNLRKLSRRKYLKDPLLRKITIRQTLALDNVYKQQQGQSAFVAIENEVNNIIGSIYGYK